MISKYSIDYIALPVHTTRILTHHTEDPVEAEEFLMHLLASGSRICAVRHSGAELTPAQSDQMIKLAAARLAGIMVRRSLDLKVEEVIHRFGFAG
jgi:hypothetical protein